MERISFARKKTKDTPATHRESGYFHLRRCSNCKKDKWCKRVTENTYYCKVCTGDAQGGDFYSKY